VRGKAFSLKKGFYFIGQKPQAIKPGMSLEKQHDFRTGTFTKLVGL
jgi:hypothetical protein